MSLQKVHPKSSETTDTACVHNFIKLLSQLTVTRYKK